MAFHYLSRAVKLLDYQSAQETAFLIWVLVLNKNKIKCDLLEEKKCIRQKLRKSKPGVVEARCVWKQR
jgi:hypothetical protein